MITITWFDRDNAVLKINLFDLHSDSWHLFEQCSLFQIIQSGGESCTHITMSVS
jgi:low temperature requirement protein LtrA